MLSLAASDSSAGAPRVYDGFTPEAQLERHLQRAQQDARHADWLFGALLVSKVYVTDYEILLGHYGPFIELSPHDEDGTRTLPVFTSRVHVPTSDAADVEMMPFAELLRSLDPDTELCLNPHGPRRHRITVAELDMLRRILDE